MDSSNETWPDEAGKVRRKRELRCSFAGAKVILVGYGQLATNGNSWVGISQKHCLITSCECEL